MDVPAAITLYDLDLGTKAHNSLERAGIETVTGLCDRRPAELLEIPYLGAGQLAEIKRALARFGLVLKPPAPPPRISAREAGQRARRQREGAMRIRGPRDAEAEVTAWKRTRHGQG